MECYSGQAYFDRHCVLCGAVGPRTIGAAKTWYGHAETAAGAVGLARVADAIKNGWQAEIQHLRSLNSYVTSIFASHSQPSSPGGMPLALTLMLSSQK